MAQCPQPQAARATFLNNARRDRPIAQLVIYTLALSKHTGIPLFDIKSACRDRATFSDSMIAHSVDIPTPAGGEVGDINMPRPVGGRRVHGSGVARVETPRDSRRFENDMP